MWQRYETVTTLAEALALLHDHGPQARVVAGGTDLLIELERGQRRGVNVIVDISRVPGQSAISRQGDRAHLGALTTHNHVVASALLVARALPLAQACWEVGAPQIRNRATVAGNLITASPANDTITPLLALDADVTLTSLHGQRTVPLQAFYTGLRRTVMQPDELLTSISFDLLGRHERGAFAKLGLRRAQAISVVNAAIVLAFDGDVVTRASVALGCVAPIVVRVPTVEQALVGQVLTPEVVARAARLAAASITPIDDVRGSADYRREMTRVMVARLLTSLATAAPAPSWGAQPAMLWGPAQGHVNGHAARESATHVHGTPIVTTINGQVRRASTGYDQTLLDFLRDHLGLVGTKSGCAEGECGACTVFLDGAAVMSCMVPAPRAHHAEVVTVEGLAAPDGTLHPVQAAYVAAGAVQCGFCTPGLLMASAKLLEEHPQPSLAQVQQSLSGNLCRCTGYTKIIEAVQAAGTQAPAQE